MRIVSFEPGHDSLTVIVLQHYFPSMPRFWRPSPILHAGYPPIPEFDFLRSTLPTIATALTLALALPGVAVLTSEPASAVDSSSFTSTAVFSDDMSRSLSAGLGTSTSGGSYTLSDASAFSVSNGTARASVRTPGTSVSAVVSNVSLVDAATSVEYTLDQLPQSGGGIYLSLQARQTSTGHYHVQVRVDPQGRVLLETIRTNGSQQTSLGRLYIPNFTATPGVPFRVDTQITGTSPVSIDARVSAVDAVRTDWNLSVQDSSSARIGSEGKFGVRSYVSSSSPAQAVRFDDLTVAKLTPAGSTTAPTPTPTPTPTSPTAPVPPQPDPSTGVGAAPAWGEGGARNQAGSAQVGSTSYAVPAGAVFVDSDAAAGGTGSVTAPYNSIQTAIDRSASGTTIVLRGGTYHQTATVPSGKALTIQSYPGEAVWLDGSEKISGWTPSGASFYSPGWTYDFDASPSFTKGGADGTTADWTWVNPAHPMASHPEQVWIDGIPQREVSSLSQLTAGTFFTDTAGDRLYLGTNPSGHEVRASTLTKALSLRGEGTVLRGIGVRGYATSIWMMGSITAEAPKIRIENVEVYDSASTGLFVGAADTIVKNVTVARNGLTGLGANYADRLRVEGLLAVENNSEHFNQAPVSGGLKITHSRGFAVAGSAFMRNDGPGLWADESVYDIDISGSDFIENLGTGVSLELSQKVDFVNNLVLRNVRNAMKINNTGGVNIWNNTIVGGDRVVNIVQDSRSATDPSVPGHDSRQPFPDPTMPWLIRDISIGNNVIAQSSGNCTFCVEDYSHKYAASDLNIKSNGNIMQRDAANKPSWFVVWSRGTTNVNPYVFSTFADYRFTTGQDARSLAVEGRTVTDSAGKLLSDIASQATNVALAPPTALVGLLGSSSATLGARMP